MSWKDDKNLGPWEFAEQPNKWGYLNNPNWMNPSGEPVNYNGRESEEPQIWTPYQGKQEAGDSNTHNPCGHWHKGSSGIEEDFDISGVEFYQQSIDVFNGRIAMAGMISNGTGGIVCVEYYNGVWYVLGGFTNMNQYIQPNTLRISGQDSYIAYFSSYTLTDDLNTDFLSVCIFDRGQFPTRTIVWEGNATGTPYEVDTTHFYNVMDCYGSRMACIAGIIQEAGAPLNKFQIKVSNDSGISFPTSWTFPTTRTAIGGGGYFDRVYLRMSNDGIVWVAYLRSSGPAGTHMIELWKSNAGATSWSKVWETDFYAALGNSEVLTWAFDILEADGEQIAIILNGYTGGLYRRLVYESTNYGVAFSSHADDNVYASSNFPKATANGDYIVQGNRAGGFYRSTDAGATWGTVATAPIVLSNNANDQQKYLAEIVYTECGESFSPPAVDPNLISLIYSEDNGLTWVVMQTPFEIADSGNLRTLPYFPGYEAEYVGPEESYTSVIITNTVTLEAKTMLTVDGLFVGRPARWVAFIP